jgi:hypothetical protein
LKGHVPFLDIATAYLVSPWDYQKLSVIYLLLILALLAYKYGNLNTFFCVAALFPNLYGTLFFATAGLLVGAIILKVTLKAAIQWSSIGLLVLSLVSYQLFYTVNTIQIALQPIINLALFEVSLKNFASTSIRLSIFMLPYLVLFWINKNTLIPYVKKHLHLAIAFSVACLASFGGWSLLHLQVDSLQLFSNFSIPAICIGICFSLQQLNWQKQLFILLVAIAINYPKYMLPSNLHALNEAEVIFKSRNHGVFFKNGYEYTNPYNISPHYANPLSFVYLTNSHLRMTDLSIVDAAYQTGLHTPFLKHTLANNEFNLYLQSHHETGIAAKVNFIKTHDISFLICPIAYPLPLDISNIFQHKTTISNQEVWY